MFSPRDLQANILGTPARNNRYTVTIVPPLKFFGKFPVKQLTYTCNAATIPGRAFITQDQMMYGVRQKLPMESFTQT